MNKIIYFDEDSATDILLMKHGGQITEINEESGAVHLKGESSTTLELGAGTGFLNIIKAAFNTKLNVNTGHTKDNLVKKTVTNTILTDFLGMSRDLKEDKTLEILEGFKVHAVKDSFAFIKMYAPYFKIFKEESEAIKEAKDFNIQNMDEVMSQAKGYYELLAYNIDEEDIILRFNINAFKNAYTLTDLPKMNLTYIAVEVGSCELIDLNMEHEFSGEQIEKLTIDVNQLMGRDSIETQENDTLKLYDVILAGVGVIE